jgi:hypothetical protein
MCEEDVLNSSGYPVHQFLTTEIYRGSDKTAITLMDDEWLGLLHCTAL